MEKMGARVEVWPVAADEVGIWQVAGVQPWLSDPIRQDSDPHFEVEELLFAKAGILGPALIHSTSWRSSGPNVILTYVVVVDVDGPVLGAWPDAKPISREVLVGHPPSGHGAAEPPAPHRLAVLGHAVRHVAFLRQFDTTAAAALPAAWDAPLDALRPALAGWYRR